jgi:hypothetical protein
MIPFIWKLVIATAVRIEFSPLGEDFKERCRRRAVRSG